MGLKDKNRLTLLALAFLAFIFYIYALPPDLIDALGKALKRAINAG
jgi:hypothetical protein